jgi:hypothetical protein
MSAMMRSRDVTGLDPEARAPGALAGSDIRE